MKEPSESAIVQADGAGASVLRVLLIGVVVLVPLGCFLLASSANAPQEAVRAVSEGQASLNFLRLVKLMCINYAYPTSDGTEVKALVFRLGLAGILWVTAVTWALAALRSREETEPAVPVEVVERRGVWDRLKRTDPVTLAQVLAVVGVVWSVLSRSWSRSPDLSLWASVVVAMQVAWAIFLARVMMSLGSIRRTTGALILGAAVGGVAAAAMALRVNGLSRWPSEWFFPVGWRAEFAACLVPVVLFIVCHIPACVRRVLAGMSRLGRVGWLTAVGWLAVVLGGGLIAVWGIAASGSLAAWAGLVVGGVTYVIFRTTGRVRRVMMVVGAVGIVAMGVGLVHIARTRGSLEAADLRQCWYGWKYALRTWVGSRGSGVGESGFLMTAQQYVPDDLVTEPVAMGIRWRGHAQNEFMEVLAEQGVLGLILRVALLWVTLRAGVRAFRGPMGEPTASRLAVLMAALISLCVEECMGCGLRLEPLPVLWYSVLAGIWATLALVGRQEGGYRPPAALRGLGALGLAALGGFVVWLGWSDFKGEHALALSSYRAPTHRVAEAIPMANEASRRLLRPERRTQVDVIRAEAYLGLATEGMSALGEQCARRAAASQPVTALWSDLAFRSKWDQVQRDAELALRSIGEVQGRFVNWPGASALEADTCRVLAQMAMLKADLVGRQNEKAFEEAYNELGRYHRRHMAALRAELTRRPFSDHLTVALIRAERDRPTSDMIDWIRRPLRGVSRAETYQAVILQVSTNKDFYASLGPYMARAESALKEGHIDWKRDPFSPETLRLAAEVRAAERKTAQAVALAQESVALYKTDHCRLAVQEALAQSDVGWYQLMTMPEQPATAVVTLQRALETSELPDLHPWLHPVYRRMVQALLAAGDEGSARQIAAMIPWAGSVDPSADLMLGWSYEVLAKTFHRLEPSERPRGWGRWVERALELDQSSSGIQLLVAAKSVEQGDVSRAAESIRKAWTLSGDLDQYRECLRTLDYALRKHPQNSELRSIYQRIVQALGAAAATRPAEPSSTMPGQQRSPVN